MAAILKILDLLRRLFDWIVVIANGAASAWIFVLMALITTDIVLRFIFGAPISGVTEIVEISIVIIVYLQLTHTLKVGRMTRSDALYTSILRRFPPVGHVMGILFSVAGVVLMIAIIKGGWPKWIQAYEGGHFIGNAGVFTFPEWPQRLVLVIGCAMLAIQFALLALDNFRGLFGKPPLEHEEAVDVEVAAVEESLK
ncbi:MAG: TRAP transporter small permease subunit [Alphaproteobacteria bacterium]|nr:TRAP transporter small permease subunit [Alphaproteobacteria bacterium]